MTVPSRQARHARELVSRGHKRVYVMMSPADLTRLAQLRMLGQPSDQEAIRFAIVTALETIAPEKSS